MISKRERPLFILEMANNHMGDIDHAKMVINKFADVTKKYRDQFDFAFKFQHRDFSIIHPDYKERNDIKMVKRLNDTRLTPEEFMEMKEEASRCGFITMCTPFDELSVQTVVDCKFDILKIASCSCADWPLMEEISKTNLPIIFSTGGASLASIDAMVTFLRNRKKDFAIMHCVGAYPTLDSQLQMNQIDLLKNRYRDVPIGFSTHEEPDNTDAIKIAIAKGCMIFERHVGIKTDKYSINGYSSNPEQIDSWLSAAKKAFEMCGVINERMPFSEKEICDLNDLYRGVYAKNDIKAGDVINGNNVFYAMPMQKGQLASRSLSKYSEYIATIDISVNEPVMVSDLKYTNVKEKISVILKEMSEMLKRANVTPPDNVPMAISAHYGIDRFYEYGTILIDVLNREYGKKILVMMPGQKHPMHYHKVKEETFHILDGKMEVEMDGCRYSLNKGDLLTVPRGAKHSFWSDDGCIIEEISTNYQNGDSYYDDKEITNNPHRKFPMVYYSEFMYL